jgi:exodeoxyribonuclease X
MHEAIVIDSETTGLVDPEVIEVAWEPIDIDGEVIEPGMVYRFKPSKPISLGAMAVHGIMDEDLVDCQPSSSFHLPDGVKYIIGHNVDFDWTAIGKPDVKRIDMLAMCRTLWPEADSHTQGAMLYLLERGRARELLANAHSAGADVRNCERILRHVLDKAGPFNTFEDLWLASERMRVPTHISFGMHKGKAIKDLPLDYRRWVLKQADMDPYTLQAVKNSM